MEKCVINILKIITITLNNIYSNLEFNQEVGIFDQELFLIQILLNDSSFALNNIFVLIKS